MPDPDFQKLLEHPRIHRASGAAPPLQPGGGIPTGYARLDRALPEGGWPRGVLTEILSDGWGTGELRLCVPGMAHLVRGGGWLAWIGPPFRPYAPGLAGSGLDLSRLLVVLPRGDEELVWSAEQAMRAGCCSAVFLWGGAIPERRLRRLQLAAEEGGVWAVLFRPDRHAGNRSPAALRLRVSRDRLHLFKVRGGPSASVPYDADMSTAVSSPGQMP